MPVEVQRGPNRSLYNRVGIRSYAFDRNHVKLNGISEEFSKLTGFQKSVFRNLLGNSPDLILLRVTLYSALLNECDENRMANSCQERETPGIISRAPRNYVTFPSALSFRVPNVKRSFRVTRFAEI